MPAPTARRRNGRVLPTQGKRSGVEIAAADSSSSSSSSGSNHPNTMTTTATAVNGGGPLESIDKFFDMARSPEEKKDDDHGAASAAAAAASTTPAAAITAAGSQRRTRKGPQRKAQASMRLSLPGQGKRGRKMKEKADNDNDNASTASEDSSTAANRGKAAAAMSVPSRRKIMGVPSPSELSKVSTLPPTPRATGMPPDDEDEDEEELQQPPPQQSPLLTQDEPPETTPPPPQQQEQEEIEMPRHAAKEDDVAEQPATMNEDGDDEADFPMQDDGGDDASEEGDDLAPPVMEDDDDDEDDNMDQDQPVPEQAPAPEEDEEDDRKPAATTTLPENGLSDTESDDEKEGTGFNMVHDAETPETDKALEGDEEKVRGRKKKKSKHRATDEDDDTVETENKTPGRKSKKKKGKRVVFSPKGIPIGNRDYNRIPIVEPSPDDEGGLRRSRRARTSPLEFWRNEKMEYGPADDDIAEEIGDMPIPRAVVRALDTPYRKRKVPTKSKVAPAAAAKSKKAKGKKRFSKDEDGSGDDNDDSDDETFDFTKLKRKFKNNLLEGEEANVWDDGNDDLNDLKVVSYAAQMEAAELPLSSTRSKEEGTVVGSAAQAFNVPSDANDNYVGYIVGNLLLPPRGIKDAESVGPCSQTFTVCTGQKKALEVAFADPDGQEGMLEDDSAQRFLLGPGDLFRVPPGNTYRLENHSTKKSCLLTWTIIRPRNPPDHESSP